MRKQQLIWILGVMLSLLFSACSRTEEVSSLADGSEYFIKKYGTPEYDFSTYVAQTRDGNILVVGQADNLNKVAIAMKMDKSGNVLWKKFIECQTEFVAYGLQLDNGNHFLSSLFSSEYIELSESGDIVQHDTLTHGYFLTIFPHPVLGDDGKVYATTTNGLSTGSRTTTLIRKWEDGKCKLINVVDDYDIGAKQLFTKMIGYENGTYYFAASLFTYPWTGWSDQIKSAVFSTQDFFAYSGAILSETTPIDDWMSDALLTKDKHIITLCTPARWQSDDNTNNASPDFTLFKTDRGHNLVWKKKYEIGAVKAIPTKVEESTDGYLISGFCKLPGSEKEYPFMLEVNPAGDVIHKQIFDINGRFYAGISVDDGYIYTGETYAYGKGKDAQDIVLIKTDKDGNYQ